MPAWKIALAAALPAAAALLTVLFFIYCLCKSKSRPLAFTNSKRPTRFCGGVACLGNTDPLDLALRHSSRVASVWRTNYPIKLFSWSEHPALVAEAVEHGWATFGFTHTCSTCPMSSNLWDMCTGCSHGEHNEPEISWEMGAGSDYMQKVRLNPGLRMKRDNAISVVQALQTTLPLPGPTLSPWPFPQQGYYEITIFAEGHEYDMDLSQNSFNENERVKLISKQFSIGKHLSSDMASSFANEVCENTLDLVSGGTAKDAIVHENPASRLNRFELVQIRDKEFQTTHSIEHLQVVAVGLGSGGAPPFRFPGCDSGSVGFHSNGRVYLNGALHIEQEPKSPIIKRKWGYVNTIVGCGFDPTTKRMFFTLNGEIVYELTATSTEFGCPLYPTIAANYDVALLANFGQSTFQYSAANSQRIPDPCFKRPLSRSAKNGFVNEDSGDLFSMGRIDAQWLGELESPSSQDLQHRHVLSEAESDLFEIVLDGRS